MKQTIKKMISLSAVFLICLTMLPLSANADENLTVNGEKVSKGDTITYEYYLGGIKELVAGAGCNIEYDPEFLEYEEDSIGFDVFNNAIFNIKEEGIIYYSVVNGITGYDLSEEKLAVTVTFKVLDTAKGSTEINHTFEEFFALDDNLSDITEDDYEAKVVLTVNSYEGVNSSPFLGTDADEMQEHLATSSVTIDDLLEGNPNSEVVASEEENDDNIEETSSASTSSKVESKPIVIDVTSKTSDDEGDNSSKSETSSKSDDESAITTIGTTSATSQNGEASNSSKENSSSKLELQVDGELEPEDNNGKAIITGVIFLFVAVLAGAAVYLIKTKAGSKH